MSGEDGRRADRYRLGEVFGVVHPKPLWQPETLPMDDDAAQKQIRRQYLIAEETEAAESVGRDLLDDADTGHRVRTAYPDGPPPNAASPQALLDAMRAEQAKVVGLRKMSDTDAARIVGRYDLCDPKLSASQVMRLTKALRHG